MKPIKNLIFSFTIFLSFILNLTLIGCETVKGLGQDFENTGENLTDVADKISPPAEKKDTETSADQEIEENPTAQ